MPISSGKQVKKTEPAKPRNHVLLVDDHEANILVGRTYLEMFGYDVDIARDGKAAVACAAENLYVAIIMDIEMPVMDGIEATKAIRRNEAEQNQNRTPIVVLTSHLTTGVRHLCAKAGADAMLPKPMTADLQSTLANLIAREQ